LDTSSKLDRGRSVWSLLELRSAVSNLLLGHWVQNDMRRLDSLRKPSKVRRRLARDSKPWDRALHFLAQAGQATDTVAAIDLLLSAIKEMKGLPGISEGARFFVLSELVEASARPRIERLHRQHKYPSAGSCDHTSSGDDLEPSDEERRRCPADDFTVARDGIVASEYRRVAEEAIADLFEIDRCEYERRLELGRNEFLAIRS